MADIVLEKFQQSRENINLKNFCRLWKILALEILAYYGKLEP